jgi:NADP-dependent 3-hydroxy acid dehydrogenase YdfG
MNVLVTGSSSGIGETIAQALVEGGHKVVLMARREDKIRSHAQALNRQRTGHALPSPGDVGKTEDCEKAVEAGLEAFGHLDALLNAAGAWVDKRFAEITYNEIENFISTDVLGAVKISRAIFPALKQNGGGRILHINGLQGFLRQHSPVLYTTVETAVRGLCESLRWEAVKHGIHVSLITLGSVASDEPPNPDPKAVFQSGVRYRLSRMEVADTVLFVLNQPPGVNIDELILTPLGQSF